MINFQRIRYLIRKECRVKWRLQRAEAKATKITSSISGMPHGSGVHSQVEDGAIRISEIRDLYSGVIAELEEARNELKPLINELENPDEVACLRLRYLDGHSAEDIADAIGYSTRQVYRLIRSAESKLVSECHKL